MPFVREYFKISYTVLPVTVFHVPPLLLNCHVPIPNGESIISDCPSRLVQGLVEKGLIYKGTSQTDARYSVLYLTKAGKELIPKIIEKEKEFGTNFGKVYQS